MNTDKRPTWQPTWVCIPLINCWEMTKIVVD